MWAHTLIIYDKLIHRPLGQGGKGSRCQALNIFFSPEVAMTI